MDVAVGEPLSWKVHGLTVEGLAWGSKDGRPVLALHGWLDNAASFAVLAPLLEGFRVVALDLTGQGRTDRRAEHAGYQVFEDLPEILAIVDELGWDQFDLVGHSRGGIISGLFASAFPERVRRLVMLDALSPDPVEESRFPAQLRQAILDKQRLVYKQNRSFDSSEEAVASRMRHGLGENAARLIAERNLDRTETGYTWSTDPRLTGASMIKMTQGHIRAVLGALTMPVLLLLATDAGRRLPEIETLARECIADLQVEGIVGGHHFHMEHGVDEAAQHITSFLLQEEAKV